MHDILNLQSRCWPAAPIAVEKYFLQTTSSKNAKVEKTIKQKWNNNSTSDKTGENLSEKDFLAIYFAFNTYEK